MTIRIISWNINSVRKRVSQLAELQALADPDIICLQETRTPNDQFPTEEVAALGYTHMAINGFKGRNGVAILSRLPFVESSPAVHEFAMPHATGDAHDTTRHQGVSLDIGLERPLRLHNFYVPAGGDVPDESANPKFNHKLRFIDDVTEWSTAQVDHHALLVGDFNIAPHENDVWSHRQMIRVVSHTPIEVAALARWQGQGWVDVGRDATDDSVKLHTWWSYRVREWTPESRGLRLDHLWASPSLFPYVRTYKQWYEPRSWHEPSDHIPIMLEIAP